MAATLTRRCTRCQKNRQLRFFTGARGRICTDCQRKTRRASTHGRRIEVTYGVTRAEWLAIFKYQGGRCAICGGLRGYRLDVDHDHRLAERRGVRASVMGLLCRQCNRVLLPAAYRNPAILRAAAEYLEDPPAPKVLKPRRRLTKVR